MEVLDVHSKNDNQKLRGTLEKPHLPMPSLPRPLANQNSDILV